MNRLLTILSVLLLFSISQIFAQENFTRVFSIPTSTWEVGGFGGIVAGVDFDNDGMPEFYACNTNMIDRCEELIPRLYKFEWNGSDWEMVWMAETDIPQQNTWPALDWGDLDKDGKFEIIWGPTNYLEIPDPPCPQVANPNPPRILIYEYPGDGSDDMGVFDGVGGYLPNASTTIVDVDNFEVRPFRFVIEDIDGDGDDEIIFVDRRADTDNYQFGVVSVDNIPDFADGTETWTIKSKGLDFPSLVGTGNKWDLAVVDNNIYLWNELTSDVHRIKYENTNWEVSAQVDVGEGSFKGSVVVDIDEDGTKEIVVGSWFTAGTAKVFLHKQDGDTLLTFEIADLSTLGGVRLNGAAYGDLDNDGYVDFVFGSRDMATNSVNNPVFRVSYQGGDITDPNNYISTMIDSLLFDDGGDLDVVAVANIDGDPEDEVLYTQGYSRGNADDTPLDIAILDITWTPPTSVERESSNIPADFYVEQNYPNPFNPSTVIKFGLTEATTVDLRIYDVLGREVAILVNNENLEAGSYNATFNAEGLASGIYVYRITAGNNTTSMKMQLLK